MHLTISSAKWRPFCPGGNGLNDRVPGHTDLYICTSQWRNNERDGVSNHQPHDCLLNRLFRHRSKKTSKPRVTGLCGGIHRPPVNSPHKGPVTRKMFPFDDVIMSYSWLFVMCLSFLIPSHKDMILSLLTFKFPRNLRTSLGLQGPVGLPKSFSYLKTCYEAWSNE